MLWVTNSCIHSGKGKLKDRHAIFGFEEQTENGYVARSATKEFSFEELSLVCYSRQYLERDAQIEENKILTNFVIIFLT